MTVDEWILAPRRIAPARKPLRLAPQVEVRLPCQPMWFVDAARRPSIRLAPHPSLAGVPDRRTTTVLLPVRPNLLLPDIGKRVIDVLGAAFLLVALFPIMAIVAAVVAATSRGGVFFVQKRVGRNDTLFPMVKFRSMVADADERGEALMGGNEGSGPLFKLRCDPRVTRVGRVLRRTSLDELPQLVNVLIGHMSLVGPRPALPREVTQYTPRERRRLEAKPGITGMWQVSGRSDLSWEDGVRLDLMYVDHWTLAVDMKILARTVTTLFKSQGAY